MATFFYKNSGPRKAEDFVKLAEKRNQEFAKMTQQLEKRNEQLQDQVLLVKQGKVAYIPGEFNNSQKYFLL